MSENSIYCGEPDIKTMKDKIRRTLNICRLHIDGVWCVRATGQVILITREKFTNGNGKVTSLSTTVSAAEDGEEDVEEM